MSADWHILSDVATELQKAKDSQEVTEIWHRFLIFLHDCRLIYSHPEESDIVMPSKTWPRNFPGGGFLRPLFAYDNLFFLDQRIAGEQCEDSFGRQALYGPPDPDLQQREIDDLSEQIGRLHAQVERLRAEVGDLQGHHLRLQRRNAELEVLVVKDSHNSSRPPSTDPPWAKRTRSLRRPSGRQPGGQAGHSGETLRLCERPTRVSNTGRASVEAAAPRSTRLRS